MIAVERPTAITRHRPRWWKGDWVSEATAAAASTGSTIDGHRPFQPDKHLSSYRKKVRLMRAFLRGYPVWCTWQVTSRCNFRCDFCDYWRDRTPPEEMMPLEGFRDGAAKLAEFGSLFISLGGGEPLLRPDIVPIVNTLARWHQPFITTNGWLATREIADDLFRAGIWGVSVSLDSADAETHDRYRGRRGAFEHAIAALDAFSRARRYDWQRVNVMCTLTERNLHEIEPLLQLAARYRAYFMVQPYCPLKTGRGRPAPDRPVGEYLVSLWRRYGNFLNNPHFLSRFDEYFAGGISGCLAGRAFFNIDAQGRIARCVEFSHRPIGRLEECTSKVLSARLRAEYRRNHCKACWYNCRGEMEMLYSPLSFLRSLPTYLFDTGKAPANGNGHADPSKQVNLPAP